MSDNIEFQMEEQIYNKRVRCEYTPFQQQMMELKKQKIILELKILGLEGISEIYENLDWEKNNTNKWDHLIGMRKIP